jgi:hypothetical protein
VDNSAPVATHPEPTYKSGKAVQTTGTTSICLWPGINAARVEQLVTRKIEEKLAEISEIQRPNFEYFRVRSLTLDGMSVVNVQIDERYPNVQQIFNDVDLKLRQITNLPQGAGPIQFFSDFGDTAALMLTVASPRESAVAISLRALAIRQAIIQARARFASEPARTTIVLAFPQSLVVPNLGERVRGDLAGCLNGSGTVSELVAIEGYGFVGLDGLAPSANAYMRAAKRCVMEVYGREQFDPDVWEPALIGDPRDTEARLAAVAGARYSYRELDEFTNLADRVFGTRRAPNHNN